MAGLVVQRQVARTCQRPRPRAAQRLRPPRLGSAASAPRPPARGLVGVSLTVSVASASALASASTATSSASAAGTGAAFLAAAFEAPTRRARRLRRSPSSPAPARYRHRGVVALARLDLDDAGVAAIAVGEERPDLGEQAVHHVLVADLLEHLAPVVQRALLGVGDQLLGVGPQCPSLGLGGLDPAVLKSAVARLARIAFWCEDDPPRRGPLVGLGIADAPV